jgi:protein required for attachment to host cells
MTTTWILVAHRGGARLLANPGPGKGLQLVEDIPHPEGRLKDGDINADKPGRVFDIVGAGRHSMSTEQAPTERVAQQFAKSLAQRLQRGRNEGRYSALVLVAEPRFLGELRAALDAPTAALVSGTVDKDLGGIDTRDLAQHLAGSVKL